MLDPTDAVFNRLGVGDQTTTGDPSAGAYGEPPPHIESECPPNQFEPLHDADVAAGATVTVRSPYPPEYFIVSVEPVATAEVRVYLGVGGANLAVRLFAGWSAKIPGLANTDLTVIGVGATANVNIIAVRGYDANVSGGA
jgi:hypothetical protein